jgi:hypothetical protein
MKQQDFWTWSERREPARELDASEISEASDASEVEVEQGEDEGESAPSTVASEILSVRGARGRLFLAELPPDLGHCLRDIQDLHRGLERHLGPVDLVLTDNRRRMVSVKKRRSVYRLRVHHMFIGADEGIVEALSDLALGQGAVEIARQVLKEYIAQNRETITNDVDAEALQAQGEVYDLQVLLDRWRIELDPEGLAAVVITWGRYGRGYRTIRFGSYDFDRKLIRIHPALDQAWVPEAFVEFIVYHELLHALFPPRKGKRRRVVHTREFRKMEEKFPGFDQVMAWEAKNLSRFLER